MKERVFEIYSNDAAFAICGPFNVNIDLIEKELGASIVSRGNDLKISGDDVRVDNTYKALEIMVDLFRRGNTLDEQSIRYCVSLVTENKAERIKELSNELVFLTSKGKPIRAKTLGQKDYLKAIEKHTITFGIGPAGTGKTYLAVAMAVKEFKAGDVSRIILTRPAVEAGEKLGFLPGDLQNKVDPYLRPIYDGLFDMLGAESYQKLIEKGTIEVAPLAYMRGRTLDDSFIILDEAQNTTREQMKMFLTRMGMNSKVVVTGDVTQIDLPRDKKSGLKDAVQVLRNVDDIAIVRLTEKDVVRHKLVQEIVRAYEKAEGDSRRNSGEGSREGSRSNRYYVRKNQ